MPRYELRDIAGKQFGELTVLDLDGFDRNHHSMWRCLCSCGVEKVIRGTNLVAPEHPTISCGHVQREMARVACGKLTKGKFGAAHPMHGWVPSPETHQRLVRVHTKPFAVKTARQLRKSGWSDRKIAKHMGVGRTMVGRKLTDRQVAQ